MVHLKKYKIRVGGSLVWITLYRVSIPHPVYWGAIGILG